MQAETPYQLTVTREFRESDLQKGVHILILHASRIPPHIGMIVAQKYHSLSIKGQETDQALNVLLKNIHIRKIPSLFIKIKQHPTFSDDHLGEQIMMNIRQFPKVEAGGATCLSPVKLFFEENYNVATGTANYIFELLSRLEECKLIEHVSSLFIDKNPFLLPIYNFEEINREIDLANAEMQKIRKALI